MKLDYSRGNHEHPSSIIIAAITILLVVALMVFVAIRNKNANKLSPLSSIAFILVVAGAVNGDDRIVCYSLMRPGVILAVIDFFVSRKK